MSKRFILLVVAGFNGLGNFTNTTIMNWSMADVGPCLSVKDFAFIVIGGGIAGVTCAETV